MTIRSILALFVCFTLGTGRTVERVEVQATRLKETLQLTAEQTSRVKEILTRHPSFERNDMRVKEANMRERLKASITFMDKADIEIEKIVSKEQQRKFGQYKEERRQEMRERMKERQL